MASIERQLAQEFRADSLYLTADGLQMHEENPDLLVDYLAVTRTINDNPNSNSNGLEWIGSGCFGYVYGLPTDETACFKLVSPRTTRTLKGSAAPVPPNLETETKYMNLVSRYLDERAAGPRAPRQFGVIKYPGRAAVSFQQRIPSEFATIKKLGADADDDAFEGFLRQGEMALDRLTKVLGKTALRLGIGDGRNPAGNLNTGNFLLPVTGYTGEEEFFAIDLLGFKRKKKIVAAGLTRLLAA